MSSSVIYIFNQSNVSNFINSLNSEIWENLNEFYEPENAFELQFEILG